MIIGLHGKMGAGKNEVAKRLALLSPDVVEVSFAAKLKESAAAALGCTVDDLEEWKNDNDMRVTVSHVPGVGITQIHTEQSVRSFLQRKGTEAGWHIFGVDFWSDQALPLDKDYSDALYVVTDVRFPGPTKRVRDLGGIVVGVRGPDESDSAAHASEVEVECDMWIDNTIRDDNYASLDRQLSNLFTLLVRPSLAA